MEVSGRTLTDIKPKAGTSADIAREKLVPPRTLN